MPKLRRALCIAVVTATIAVASACDDTSTEAPSSSADGGVDAPSTSTSDAGENTPTEAGADAADRPDGAPDAEATGTFTLTSSAFVEGGTIPKDNALCPDGSANQSPPLAWTNAPAGTQSFAVVMRDLDVAAPDNYHWVLWDIPAATTSLPAGIQAVAAPTTPAGAKQTHWSFGSDYSYQGPCPPSQHSYQFTIYAFAVPTLPIAAGETSPKAADAVIQANKTASASLTGEYAK